MEQLTLKVKKVNQINPTTKKMGYAARVVTNGTETMQSLLKYATRNTSTHWAEAYAAAELLMEAAANALRNGKIVDFGPLGKLRPSVQSKWVEKPEDLVMADLTKSMLYVPSLDVSNAIQSAVLSWSTAKDKEGDGTDDPDNNNGGTTDNTGTNDNTDNTGTTDNGGDNGEGLDMG